MLERSLRQRVARYVRFRASRQLCWLLLCFCSQAAAASLATEIATILDRPAAQRAFWGIKIVALESGDSLYEHNADKLFVPASNAKLFSTALGLMRLGPDYRYSTEVVASQPASEKGIIAGNIVLLGGGDPNLSARVVPYDPDRAFNKNPLLPITELVSQIVAAGVREIDGDVIGDDSRYVWQRHGTGWSIDDSNWGYGAPISALSYNDNVVHIRVLPGRATGHPARVDLQPEIGYFSLKNRVRTARSRTVARRLRVSREPGSLTVSLWGEISIRSPGRNIPIAVEDPALFAALALRDELERQGVDIRGETRSRRAWPHEFRSLKRAPSTKKPLDGARLAVLRSASLAEILQVINKDSQNLHAEMLLREVGYTQRGVGSFDAGLAELKTFLLKARLKPWEFKLRDASGLSRQNLVTPSGTVKLLKHMWTSRYRDDYLKSFPLAGEDGTLDWRFARTAARGRIRAKTGSLTNVTALSGYAVTLDGRDLAFSVLVNNFGVPSSYIRKLVDDICLAVIQPLPSAPTPTDEAVSQKTP